MTPEITTLAELRRAVANLNPNTKDFSDEFAKGFFEAIRLSFDKTSDFESSVRARIDAFEEILGEAGGENTPKTPDSPTLITLITPFSFSDGNKQALSEQKEKVEEWGSGEVKEGCTGRGVGKPVISVIKTTPAPTYSPVETLLELPEIAGADGKVYGPFSSCMAEKCQP